MKSERWRFLTELIPLTLLLVCLDRVVLDESFFAWEPSPLWLLILLVAPRHGSLAGLVSGLVAASLFLWNMSAQGYFWQDLLHRHPASLIMPALLLLVGVYLGTLRESLAMQAAFFRSKVQTLTTQLDISEVKRTQLERSRIEMEKRIAGQSNTLVILHESFKRLGEADSEEKLLLLLDIILREETKAEACGIWRIVDGQAQFLAGNLNPEIPPLAQWVGKKRSVVTAAAWSQYTTGDAPGADIAGLILDSASDRLVVALAGVPFIRMTRGLVLHFGLLAERAGIVLEAIRHLEGLRREAVQDTELGLMSEAYLRRRVDEEVSLARRHKTPLSLVACAIAGTSEALHTYLAVLSCSIRACTRLSDGLAYFSERKAFLLVLPQCDSQGAEIVLKKMEDNLKVLDLRNEQGKELFEVAWNIFIPDGTLKGEALYEHVFSGMRVRKEVLS